MKGRVVGRVALLAFLACLVACKKQPRDPSDPLAHNPGFLLSMARANLQKGNLDAALNQLQEAESLDSSNPDVENAIGLVYTKKEQYLVADRYFTKAIELKQDSGAYYVNRGFARLMEKQHEEALADFDKALSPEVGADPTPLPFAHYYKGQTYFDLQLFDKAAESYRAGLALVPQNPDMRDRLGQALYKNGQIDQALKEFEECAKANPAFADAQFQMGKVYLERSENAKACAAFGKYVELAPDGENAEPARRYLEVLRKESFCADDPKASPPQR